MKIQNHTVWEGAIGDRVEQVLLPLEATGDDVVATFKKAHGGGRVIGFAVAGEISGAALVDWFKRQQQPKGEIKKQCLDVYAEFPRKIGKPSALLAIAKALKEVPYERLLELTKMYAVAVETTWSERDKAFIPHPATFYNDKRFDDAPSTWVRSYRDSAVVPDHSGEF